MRATTQQHEITCKKKKASQNPCVNIQLRELSSCWTPTKLSDMTIAT